MTPPPSSRRGETARAATGAGLLSAATLLESLLTIGAIMVLTRVVPKESLSSIQLFLTLERTLGTVGALGLPAALLYFIPKLGPHSARSLLAGTMVTLGAAAMLVAAVLTLGRPLVEPWLSSETLALLPWLALYVGGDLPSRPLSGFLLGQQRPVATFATMVGFAVTRVAGLLVPALLGWGNDGMLAGYCVASALRLVTSVGFWIRAVPSSGARPWVYRDLLVMGLTLAGSDIVSRVNNEYDKLLMGSLLDAEHFATYWAGAQELPLIGSVAYSVTSALLPVLVMRFAQGDREGFVELWHGSMIKAATILLPVFFLSLVLAQPLAIALYGAPYVAAAVPFRVYLLLMPARLCSYSATVRALGRSRPILIASVISLGLNVALSYPMFLAVGLTGPALATVLAELASIAWMLRAIRKALGVGWAGVWPFRAVLKVAAVAGGLGLALLPLAPYVTSTLGLLWTALVFLALYVAAGRAFGLVSAADLRYLADLLSLRMLRRRNDDR